MSLHGMRRHRQNLRPYSEMNLTSLLDVAFVLLLAFMIVAPSLKYGVELDLPAVTEGAPQMSTDQQNLAVIMISKAMAPAGTNSARTYLLDGRPADLREIEKDLTYRQRASGGKLAVEIQADGDSSYEAFVQVVAAVRRAGVRTVGLPVDANGAPTTTRKDQVSGTP